MANELDELKARRALAEALETGDVKAELKARRAIASMMQPIESAPAEQAPSAPQATQKPANPLDATGGELDPNLFRQPPIKIPPAAQQALQGATLGFADEIQGWIAGLVASGSEAMRGDQGTPVVPQTIATLGENVKEGTRRVREESDAYAKENPGKSLALNAAGAIATGGPVLGAMKAAGIPVTGIKGLAVGGGTVGAVAGAGVAEEGKAVQGALEGAALGATLGPAISLFGGAGKAVLRKLAPGVKNRIQALVSASEYTPAQIATRLEALGPGATIADVDDVFRRAGDVAASRLGPAAKRVKELIRRDETQFGRLMEPIKRTLGSQDQAATTVNALKDIRIQTASPLYERAFSQPIVITNRLRDLLSRPETQKAWRAAQAIGKSDPGLDEAFLRQGADPSFKGFQAITEGLWDRASSLDRAGKSKFAGTIKDLRNAILGELDAQSDDFAKARALWAGTKQADDMVELGSKFLTTSSDDLAEAVKKMSDADKAFFRMGVGRAIEQKMAGKADTTDLGRMFRNQEFRRKAEIVFPDKESAVDFINTVRAETIKKATTNAVGRGSQTQPRQVAEKQLTGGEISTDSISKTGILNRALSLVSGPREKTIQDIGDLLLSQDPATQQRALLMMQSAQNQSPLLSLGPAGAATANFAAQR